MLHIFLIKAIFFNTAVKQYKALRDESLWPFFSVSENNLENLQQCTKTGTRQKRHNVEKLDILGQF